MFCDKLSMMRMISLFTYINLSIMGFQDTTFFFLLSMEVGGLGTKGEDSLLVRIERTNQIPKRNHTLRFKTLISNITIKYYIFKIHQKFLSEEHTLYY